jgi:hypothetical protein
MTADPKTATDALHTAAANQDVHTLCQALYGHDLAPFQQRIVHAITYSNHPHICITAPTQSGKSFGVADGVSLLLDSHPGPLEIDLVAPKRDQTKTIRTYVAKNVAESPTLRHQLKDARGGSTAERLENEASKRRLTFEKRKEFATHSAGGSLMSQGGDLLILDESGGLTEEQHAEARRMVAGSVDEKGELKGRIVEIGNPWDPTSPFARSWNSPDTKTIRIDWREAVEQGRLARSYVETERERLSSLLFTVYYKSRFPQTAEGALYRWPWIQHACKREPLELPDAEERWSLDVAEGGKDQNVLVRGEVSEVGANIDLRDDWIWDEPDTKKTTRKVRRIVPDGDPITVDALGVGKGVADDLNNPDNPDTPSYIVNKFKSSHKAQDDDYQNRYAELAADDLRTRLEDKQISLPDLNRLKSELRRARQTLTTKSIKVEYEGEKSPDCADTLIMLFDRRAGDSSWSAI